MDHTDNVHAPPLAIEQGVDQHREDLRRAIEHRFRHILRAGRVSPLFHLILRYKLEQRP
jgi:hypothetical protein